MKTNHQRGFTAETHKISRGIGFQAIGPYGVVVAGIDMDFAGGSRGYARDRAGAKKFVRSRLRFQQKRLAKEALQAARDRDA